MRRKLSYIILLVLVPLFAAARTISRDEALGHASKFFGGTDRSSLSLAWTGASQDAPAFYAFNRRGGGFVIISAEEAVNPVLGYSHEGKFSTQGMPPHIREWFSDMEKDINEVRRLKVEPSAAVLGRWRNLGEVTRAGGEFVLETAQWNQTRPYNYDCIVPDGYAYAGCVATAMAIILKYMRYPDHGRGTLPGYVTNTKKYPIEGYSIDDHVYNWDMMPLTNSGVVNGTDEQRKQVTQLIHDCGVMVGMDYTVDSGSGAASQKVPVALAAYMGYSASASLYRRAQFSNEEWEAMLSKELRQSRPVYYAGYGSGGHAFVIDGFDDNGMFHVNWGWGGVNNGFFTLSLSVSTHVYSYSQEMVLGLVPDPSGEDAPQCDLVLDLSTGLSIADGDMAGGPGFSITARHITNRSDVNFDGYVVPALVDGDGNVRELLGEPVHYTFAKGYGYVKTFSNCRISVATGFRDKVVLLYREKGRENYRIMRANHDNGSVGHLSANPYGFIDCKSRYKVGDILHLEYLGPYGSTPTVTWVFDGTELSDSARKSISLTSPGKHTVKAIIGSGSNVETITRTITVE